MEQIDETPYLETKGKFNIAELKDGSYSEASKKRLFNSIGKFQGMYELFLSKDQDYATALNPTGNIICRLEFKKHPADIPGYDKILQVDGVSVDKEYQSSGIAGALYMAIVNNGHVVVSDSIQFIPGKELWKRIARESAGKGYKVQIYKSGKFIDENYNGSNIPDSEIWTSGGNYSGTSTLMVLSK